MSLAAALDFLRTYKQKNPTANKATSQNAFEEALAPKRVGKVLVGDGYALRFSEVNKNSFSNTVLSLSALRKHDTKPFVVVAVRAQSIECFLANSTLLRKISHTSHKLRTDNIKGSFNGTDILREYEGTPNTPENFDALFAQHAAFSWEENLVRLVEATNAIVGRDNRFRPTDAQKIVVLEAPQRSLAALNSSAFRSIDAELRAAVVSHRNAILTAATIDNVNLRGNEIEQILTGGTNAHELGDLARDLNGGRLVIDIKTKLLDRASAPKAYNIDKMLAFLAEPGSVLAFFMIGVDVRNGRVVARLLPIFDIALLDAKGAQHHWAGRVSRGVTQLSGQFGRAAENSYSPQVDVQRARAFLERLLNL